VKKAFTLIELVVSIIILTIMMLFLYKSYAGLNKSNRVIADEVAKRIQIERLKKVLYLDISLAQSITIENQDKNEDIVFMQTGNSIHNRINPYVAYLVKNKVFYRLESLKPFDGYPLSTDSEFVADKLGKVTSFRLYASQEKSKKLYLLHMLSEEKNEILLKAKALNIK